MFLCTDYALLKWFKIWNQTANVTAFALLYKYMNPVFRISTRTARNANRADI